jgi:ATP-dependent DNA helicase RecG
MHQSAKSLLQQLRLRDETTVIEAKKASAIGSSVMQTVCAFSNEPGLGGGYLLLGVAEPDTQHDQFYVCGVENSAKLLSDLQTNCRSQFEQPIHIQAEVVSLEGKTVIQVFVPELQPAAKPCTFDGKFDRTNKRKTGVWRRGIDGDYECAQQELEPILLAKTGLGFEQVVLPDAEWDDLDPSAITLYRQLREKVRSDAPELQATDAELLRALNLVCKSNGEWVPNIAGLLLMGKPLALRRLLPAVRVDYVRINGTRWVENADQRVTTTLDLRDCLLRTIPRTESAILDDLPRHFRLKDGETQRSDVPLLPQPVIREAVVNALMHRDYHVSQPTLVIRYSNRIEIRNAGYSLKPESRLGEPGSEQRNPVLAAALYDLELAETKGTGIRTMRDQLSAAGLTAPVFSSAIPSNQFSATYLLHHLLGEDQIKWLTRFSHLNLSQDEEKALLLARETGAVTNSALRAITDLDTLSASELLKKLNHQLNLLDQGGAGASTYYRLADFESIEGELTLFSENERANSGEVGSNSGDLEPNSGDLRSNSGDLGRNSGDLGESSEAIPTEPGIPAALAQRIVDLTPKARRQKLWPVILWLCAIERFSADSLAKKLGKHAPSLKDRHLNALREQQLIEYTIPEAVNHPDQAYVTTQEGLDWLAAHEITVSDQNAIGRHRDSDTNNDG